MSDKLGDLEKNLNHLGQIFRYVNEVILNHSSSNPKNRPVIPGNHRNSIHSVNLWFLKDCLCRRG